MFFMFPSCRQVGRGMGEEKYAMVGTRDWEAGRGWAGQRYSLLALDSDWHELVLPHLTPG